MLKLLVTATTLIIEISLMAQSLPMLLPFSGKHSHRIDQIASMLPEKPQGLGASIDNRAAWHDLTKKYDLTAILNEAEQILNTTTPQWDDEVYLEFSRNGIRPPGEKMIGQRRYRMVPIIIAECIENKGRFLPKIEETLNEIITNRSWVLPAHDRDLRNFNATRYDVDLYASLFAQDLAQALYLLDSKLSTESKKAIIDSIYSRVLIPTRTSLEQGDGHNSWISRTDNWNSVCWNGVLGAALFALPNTQERAYYAAAAEYYSRNSLIGYTDDGYCSEGLGYFNYGFENYILLREELFQATQGAIDLFADPKVKQIAMYGMNFEIQNGVYPAFADCKFGTKVSNQVMWYCSNALNLGLNQYQLSSLPQKGSLTKFCFELFAQAFPIAQKRDNQVPIAASPLRHYFKDAGVLIVRHGSTNTRTLSAALKGGHNGEHHNHNDIGSFSIVKGSEMILGDAGGPYHYAGDMWTDKRYSFKTISSYGHPVPRFNGQSQLSGETARAKVIKADFTPQTDLFKLDNTSAYAHVDGLEKYYRTFAYSRKGNGELRITDEFIANQPLELESVLTTFGDWYLENNTLIIQGNSETIRVVINTPPNTTFYITEELLQENGPLYKRLSIKIKERISKGSIMLIIS